MIPERTMRMSLYKTFPRTRGDDPGGVYTAYHPVTFSPHPRG